MGFIPIFITLGGFVFLFVMLVHQNLKQKKNKIKQELSIISSEFKSILNLANKGLPDPNVYTIEEAIKTLQTMGGMKNAVEFQSLVSGIRQKLGEIKRIRYEHNKLVETKPYSFAAKLTGHQAL
ncbi:hypothetical protein Q4534_03145 [Cyclobacterium sp. 1_MG-2023]|uniref:hypothetical protein n=1 Tax=Cyclobacterium sp. 1_MG-2023 TaxID=3062681 RepID=UPI0026E12E28|nr:hypothetical protein [Cyclobacterium sp. 1_MG-2023]MDO6436383.1 hypothetical protein [Cyclobacterium sp. 1_MG-2023]